MIPRLTARGKWVLASALLFIAVGAVIASPPIVALGGMMMSVLLALHLNFYPVAIMLRRKKVELSWWVAPSDSAGGALTADKPFALHIAYRNHGSRRLRILSTGILRSSALDIETPAIAAIGRGQQVESVTTGVAKSCGYWHLHGASLLFGDALGLFDIEAYFPNPIAIKVFPRAMPYRSAAPRAVGAVAHDRMGLHQVRRRGLAGELREIREHVAGDSFKYIAWKASARKRKLMVRDLETEIVSTHMIFIDVGADMRQGPRGSTALDWALQTAAGLAHQSTQTGDRVGIIGFDSRVVFEVPIDSGQHHYVRAIDRLLEANCVVDEDLTDVTAGELVGQVARYLAHQEAIDVRVPDGPAIDDPRWNSIVAGADGQLYDVGVTGKITNRLLEAAVARDKQGALRRMLGNCRDADKQLLPLRKFCRLRGIELPYRSHWEHGRRSQGFAEALGRIETRVDVVYLLTDLAGLDEDATALRRAISKLRRRGTSVIAVVPALPQLLPVAESVHGKRVRHLLVADWKQQRAETKRILRGLGVTVYEGEHPRMSPSVANQRAS
jgi:uncharacterized protein (DUF58 family)